MHVTASTVFNYTTYWVLRRINRRLRRLRRRLRLAKAGRRWAVHMYICSMHNSSCVFSRRTGTNISKLFDTFSDTSRLCVVWLRHCHRQRYGKMCAGCVNAREVSVMCRNKYNLIILRVVNRKHLYHMDSISYTIHTAICIYSIQHPEHMLAG